MLQAMSLALAEQSRVLTSVARTRGSLEALDRALSESSGEHRMVQLDWSNAEEFLERLTSHLGTTGPPDLVVAWIHGRELALRFGAALPRHPDARFVHVIGSASRSPDEVAAELKARFPAREGLQYRQVVLGAQGTGPSARWLTDREISAGVLEAIARDAPTHVVGTLDRWRNG